jgi:hypothetical protein
VNICRKSRFAESPGVHEYAVNLGLSELKIFSEIWVWWQSQDLLNLDLHALTERHLNWDLCAFKNIPYFCVCENSQNIQSSCICVLSHMHRKFVSAGFDKVLFILDVCFFTKSFFLGFVGFHRIPYIFVCWNSQNIH